MKINLLEKLITATKIGQLDWIKEYVCDTFDPERSYYKYCATWSGGITFECYFTFGNTLCAVINHVDDTRLVIGSQWDDEAEEAEEVDVLVGRLYYLILEDYYPTTTSAIAQKFIDFVDQAQQQAQ